MSKIFSMQELAEQLLELLSRTAYPSEQMESYVNRLVESFKWEGAPYVEIGEKHYIVKIYERGVPSLIKKLERTEEVLYWLLEDMIFTAAHVTLLKKYGVDNVNTHLDYTNEVWQEIEDNVLKAFRAIGEPYLSWHQEGKRRELETVQPKKGKSSI
ncbi:Imm63 family immunity protein [Paenibacillus sp. TSA_86.1]|uniref:Imm63 family immunity protein n=1 Tax=Paenibacillus sp. TSA_86.1 TaxID=3415649 RepID=UPI0040454E05